MFFSRNIRFQARLEEPMPQTSHKWQAGSQIFFFQPKIQHKAVMSQSFSWYWNKLHCDVTLLFEIHCKRPHGSILFSVLYCVCWPWKTLEVMEFFNFIFQAWKVMEFDYGSWKIMKILFFFGGGGTK